MTQAYDLNDTPALTVTIRDKNSALIDPTTLTFKATAPDGTVTNYVYGTAPEVVKSGVGVYYVDLLLDASGRWSIDWTATGNVSLAENTELWVKYSGRAVTLQQAKDHLNITDNLDDALLDFIIDGAITTVENILSKTLIDNVGAQKFSCFADEMPLYTRNVKSVDSITYLDELDAQQTLSVSVYEYDDLKNAIILSYGESWPTLSKKVNPVTVNYTAGYGATASSIPPPIISAVLLLIGHLYENREATAPIAIHDVPMSVKFLLTPYRDYSI